MKIRITIKKIEASKTQGEIRRLSAQFVGELTDSDMNDHDIAACLFAIEFAANNQEALKGLRVHIEQL